MLSDPYFSTKNCIDRLYSDYLKYKNLVVGFDFDDTIFDHHKKGYRYKQVIGLLRPCKKIGFTMCLYTNERDPENLQVKKKFCEISLGFAPDFVNESPLLQGGGKPFFSILLDDRAGLKQAFDTLMSVVKKINNGKGNKLRKGVYANYID